MAKKVTSGFKDVEMTWFEDDIQKIQAKPNLYLMKYGVVGCDHLCHEVVQNAYDESMDSNSPGDLIQCIYDKVTDKLTVRDNGRGFPETKFPLEIFCTKLQSGSKSTRNQSGATAGEFGVGITLVNALSTYFSIKNYRKEENEIHTIIFEHGKKVSDTKEKNPKKLHGAEISFIPDKKYLGKTAHIDPQMLYDWIKSLSYLLSSEKKKIRTQFEIWEGLKCIKKELIEAKPFSDLLNIICTSTETQPVIIHKRGKMEEVDINGKKSIRNVLIEVVFAYDSKSTQDMSSTVLSYCNYTNTKNGGVHVDTVDECICRYLQRETKNALSDKEKEKYDILWQDIRSDLRVIINLSSNAQVQFMGNAKMQIGNESLIPIIKDLVNSGLEEVFKNNQNLLQSYTKIVKRNAKARIELNKIKSVVTKPKTNHFQDFSDANFTPCSNNGKNDYTELYLVEGQKSALGGIVNARNPKVQAIFGFRGVVANPYKRDITNIFDNVEWRSYCNKIGYDIRTGDIKNIRYNKIIISTDADTDGSQIASGICAFHGKFCRPVVEAGLLYKVYPPLYLIKDSNNKFIRNKKELIDVYLSKITSRYKIILSTGKELKKKERDELIYATEYYLNEINLIADHYFVNRALVEMIGFNLILYGEAKNLSVDETVKKAMNDSHFIKKMMSEIQSVYPEIYLQGDTIQGSIYGTEFQAITINRRLYEKFQIFRNIYLTYGLYITFKDGDNESIKGTLGDLLTSATKYMPKILDRYKGLGEADWEDLAETIMDPTKRILVQLTFDDVKRDLDLIESLHGSGESSKRFRKKMMSEYVISRDDIDT